MNQYKRVPDEIYSPRWVIKGVLAHSQRPGYPVDRPAHGQIKEWTDAVLELGIKSVLCILDYTQLAHYNQLNLEGGSLFAYYRSLGLNVEHVYAEDHKIPSLNVEEQEAALAAFQRLEKPVLIHCSAGKDRTGAAIVYILSKIPLDGR
jgi:protein tyrosine phosphatase (PTP) superfamily phosphohydrolase (DUF442 family)